jgi:putative membrane protein
MFVSRLFKRILPQLTTCILWSIICVSFITTRVKTASTHYVPLTSLSLVSTLIAFLITLRSNQSLGRLGEARQLWGRLFIVLRDTSQLLVTYVYPKDKKLGLKAVRHLSLFAWLLKDSLRDTNHTEIVETMLGGKVSRSSISNDDYSDDRDINVSNIDLAYLTSQRKKTAATVLRIRQIVADLAARNELHYAPHQQLEKNLNEMNYILGMCERLKGSPIPPVYTSHTTRLLVFYLVFLPLALHGSQVKKLVTVLVTSTVSYAMLGLDEISHVLEQPFRLMPLHDLSRNMMLDVADPFICQPPSFVKLELKTKEEEDQGEQQSPSYW